MIVQTLGADRARINVEFDEERQRPRRNRVDPQRLFRTRRTIDDERRSRSLGRDERRDEARGPAAQNRYVVHAP